jgi:hypothetical protein
MNRLSDEHMDNNRLDDAIDKTLAGLREAPVPEGMERRILKALEESGRDVSRPRRSPIFPWKIAATCATVAAVAHVFVLITGRTHTTREPAGAHPKPRSVARSALNPSSAAATPPAATDFASSKRPTPQLRRTSAVIPVRARTTEPADRHVNLPPPPLPLTREEQMLLEIAHRAPPVELAMLTPAERTAQQQREYNEYDQFFALSKAEIETEKLNSSQPSAQGKP